MECPHLEESARITTAPSVKCENNPSEFSCSVCQTGKSPWICLACGEVNCGRYVNAHAKQHFEDANPAVPNHAVCMDCHNHMAFCYVCDEFVINDTESGHLEKLRKHLESLSRLASQSQSAQNFRKEIRRRDSTGSIENVRKKAKKDDKSSRPRSSGLRNLGNTCFMNAVLQSLSNIQQFCGYIKQLPSLEDQVCKRKYNHAKKTRETGENILLIEELRKTLCALWQGTKAAISPESLFTVIWKVVPRFRGYQQQDAHEFMRYLLDRLHTELLQLLPYPNNNSPYIGPKGKSTIVTAIFGGLLQNEVNCLICGMESKKHDPFLDLSLDIPSQFCTKTTKPKEGEPMCTLSDCLSSFTDVEELEESELYMCSNCKMKQRSTKKFWIRRLPNVLCLHLKRFRWSTYCRVKLETYVDFPLRGLDMNRYVLNTLLKPSSDNAKDVSAWNDPGIEESPTTSNVSDTQIVSHGAPDSERLRKHETRGSCAGSNMYDLAAVIVHHGSGAGSGHYTAYAIHDGQWYHFNDSTVTACDEETVARCKAYILFYVRREIKLPDYLLNGSANN
ncbi:ubiquitin carboxyl-terminal hydrolase 3-like isoform X1 [Haliotis rufescens]|uniref:ubiquitin carboxyl-terminal hydrolase 3-like isoform X1 n=1 Tax=Haliotis rufescens TaxID=6454 RepID=UPI001EB02E3B|nr:ubiquitin carboxyl-terminal hydrolase 3-like isoform X1 [Haliotis rufescens]